MDQTMQAGFNPGPAAVLHVEHGKIDEEPLS